MSASERGDPKAGPFVNLNQTYCHGLDLLVKGYEPTLKNIGRWNMEAMALATRRARAWAELPGSVSRCRTAPDLVKEQVQFWQTAARDYAEGMQRLAVAFSALAGPALTGAWGSKTAGAARDYITFSEPKPAAEEAPRRERRAA